MGKRRPKEQRRLTLEEKRRIWDAVNQYAEACGGDTGPRTISARRMTAVVAIENALRDLVQPPQPSPSVDPTPPDREGR